MNYLVFFGLFVVYGFIPLGIVKFIWEFKKILWKHNIGIWEWLGLEK